MSTETELKLGVEPGTADRLMRMPWLRGLGIGPPQRRSLQTVYFDTRGLELHDRGLTLRVRHAESQRVQSVKVLGKGAGGAFERGEWEHEIASDTPDLKRLKGTPLQPLAKKKKKKEKLGRKLRPIFETRVQRTTLPIRSAGAELELAVDRGHIKARGMRQREPISEIEIELKRGNPGELVRVAKRLARSVTVSYSPQSKAGRGYALTRKSSEAPVRASGIIVDAHAKVGEAFAVIGLACLDHAIANARAIRHGDTEGIHQMRVGLRRLRAALSVFKKMLPGAETEAVKRELKWLTAQLDRARDLDVLLTGRVRSLRHAPAIADDVGLLERDLDAARAACLEHAKAAVDSARFRKIGLRVALWLADGDWSHSSAAAVMACRQMRVAEFAAAVLTKRAKKILRKAPKVDELDPHARHKLRIGIKKLRYACDFFASVFAGGKRDARRERYCKALKSLQGHLGTLNDIEVHKRLARSVARPARRRAAQPRKALAMGFISGREDKEVGACLQAVRETAARLAELPVYWR